MRQIIKIQLPQIWQLIHKVKSLLILVLLQMQTLINRLKLKYMRNNLFQRSLMPQRITRMICSCRYHLHLETMQSTWVLYLWDLQKVSPQELSSILDLNILPSLAHFVMIKLPVTLNSRNTIHYQAPSCRETNWMRDAKLKHMIWKSPIPIRSSQRLLRNLHMAQLSSKVSFGKIIAVFNLLRALLPN